MHKSHGVLDGDGQLLGGERFVTDDLQSDVLALCLGCVAAPSRMRVVLLDETRHWVGHSPGSAHVRSGHRHRGHRDGVRTLRQQLHNVLRLRVVAE